MATPESKETPKVNPDTKETNQAGPAEQQSALQQWKESIARKLDTMNDNLLQKKKYVVDELEKCKMQAHVLVGAEYKQERVEYLQSIRADIEKQFEKAKEELKKAGDQAQAFLNQGTEKASGYAETGAKAVTDNVNKGAEWWKEWSKENPKKAAAIAAVGGVALVLGVIAMVRGIGRGAKSVFEWSKEHPWLSIGTLGLAGVGVYGWNKLRGNKENAEAAGKIEGVKNGDNLFERKELKEGNEKVVLQFTQDHLILNGTKYTVKSVPEWYEKIQVQEDAVPTKFLKATWKDGLEIVAQGEYTNRKNEKQTNQRTKNYSIPQLKEIQQAAKTGGNFKVDSLKLIFEKA